MEIATSVDSSADFKGGLPILMGRPLHQILGLHIFATVAWSLRFLGNRERRLLHSVHCSRLVVALHHGWGPCGLVDNAHHDLDRRM